MFSFQKVFPLKKILFGIFVKSFNLPRIIVHIYRAATLRTKSQLYSGYGRAFMAGGLVFDPTPTSFYGILCICFFLLLMFGICKLALPLFHK